MCGKLLAMMSRMKYLLFLLLLFVPDLSHCFDLDMVQPKTVKPYRPCFFEVNGRLGRPTPRLTMKAQSSRHSQEHEYVVAVGIEEDAQNLSQVRIDGLKANGFLGETWQSLDVLDLMYLPQPCRLVETFAPALAVSPSRQELIMFGFGPQPSCHQLLVWRNGRLHTVHVHNGQAMPHFMHAIVAVDNTSDVSVPLAAGASFQLYSFGGLWCTTWPCPSSAYIVHNTLWEIEITFNGSDYEGTWKYVATKGQGGKMPGARVLPSLFSFDGTFLLLHGGFSSLAAGMDFHAMQDLWRFDLIEGIWEQIAINPVMRFSQPCSGQLEKFGGVHYESVLQPRTSLLVIAHNGTGYADAENNTSGHEALVACSLRNFSDVVCHPVEIRGKSPDVHLLRYSLVANDGFSFMIHYLGEESLTLRILWQRTVFSSALIFPMRDTSTSKGCYVGSINNCLSSNPCSFYNQHGFTHRKEIVLVGGSCHYRALFSSNSSVGIWVLHHSPSRGFIYRYKSAEPGPSGDPSLGQSITKLKDKLILFGGLTLNSRKGFVASIASPVWCFDLIGHYWMRWNPLYKERAPIHRADHVVIKIDEQSFLVYGGLGVSALRAPLGDIWLLHFTDLATCTGYWHELTKDATGATLPRIYGHRSATLHGRHFVYGGSTDNLQQDLSNSQWLYEMCVHTPPGQRTVSLHVNRIPLLTNPGPRKYHSLSPYTSNALLVLGGELRGRKRTGDAFLITLANDSSGEHAAVHRFFQTYPIQGHYVIDNMVLSGQTKGIQPSVCLAEIGMVANNRHCPRGQQRSAQNTCELCSENFFSDTLNGVCMACPMTQVTNGSGSVKCQDPDPCTAETCHGHGICVVTNSMQAVCKCNFGFLPRDNCRVPFVFISQIVVAVGLLLLAGCIVHIRKYYRQHHELRRQEAELKANHVELTVSRRKIHQLNSGTRIPWSSLNLLEKLSTGQYNDVWLAELDDMKVAVKTLPLNRKYTSSPYDAFCQEAEILRSVRHPNIVLFLGAGTDHLSGRPFIVTEYLSRGSLFDVLHEAANTFCHQDRLRFSLDIARGMAYLHSSSPPRIHRDLKSPNLLVTDKWTVKISDFGTSRFLAPLPTAVSQQENSGQRKKASQSKLKKDVSSNGLNERLLPSRSASKSSRDHSLGCSLPRSLMTAGVGTIRWRSPESLLHTSYTEKTDVYSFGVVLWEIFTRQLPYHLLQQDDDIVAAIVEGNYPPLPPSMPYEYRHLVEQCLQKEPTCRPDFRAILVTLEDQQLSGEE